MTAAAPPICAFNRFPTVVHGPCVNGGGPLLSREARTVITCPDGDTPARLLVWVRPGEPAVDAVVDLGRSNIGRLRPRTDWALVTDAGDYVVQPGRGCACGNRLKRWTPPQLEPLRMGALP